MKNSENQIEKKSEVSKINLDSLKKSIEAKKDSLKEISKSESSFEIYHKQFNSKKERSKIRRILFNCVYNVISKDRSDSERIQGINDFFNWSEKYLKNPIKMLNIKNLKVENFSNVRDEQKRKDLNLFVEILKESIKLN